MIKCPWDLDQEGNKLIYTKDYNWIIEYAQKKDIPASYFRQPQQEDKVRTFVEYLLSPRNFVLIFSRNISYVLELYNYIALSWACTTNKGFAFLDIESFDYNDVERLKSVDLLIIPHIDPDSYEIRKYRSTLGKIIGRRKSSHLALLTDCYTSRLPANNQQIIDSIQPIGQIFGQGSISLFLDKDSSARIVVLGG